MAHDFILGSTGTNWSRGFSVLLPQTPDSSSMEEKTTDSDAAKARYSVMYQGVRKNWLFVGPNKRPLLIP